MPPRILVVGSGLAGLTSAYLLRREGCEVYIVEKSEQLGFHASSVVLSQSGKAAGGSEWVVDVPMRSFQGGYYPLLISLYRHLGLSLKSSNFTFSFSHLFPTVSPISSFVAPRGDLSTYFIHSGSSGLSSPSFPSTAFRSLRSSVQSILQWIEFATCYILLLLLAFISWHSLLPLPSTLGYLLGYTSCLPFGAGTIDKFAQNILVPLFSAVGTMTTSDVLDTPLMTILEYVHCTLGTSHYALGHCSARDVARLLVEPVKRQGLDHVRLGTEMTSIEWFKGAFRVTFRDGEAIQVDRVIIATQARPALALLDLICGMKRSSDMRRMDQINTALQQVRYRDTIVVTHQDTSVLPAKDNVRDINFVLPVPAPLDDPHLDTVTPPLSPAATEESSSSNSGFATPVDRFAIMGMPYFRPTSGTIYTMGTHVIPPAKGFESEGPVLQTTNPVVPIAPDRVLGLAKLERALPLRSAESTIRALSCPAEHEGGPSTRIHIVGSYAYPGIPLLEGCVGSAIRATKEVLESSGAARRHTGAALGGVDWSAGQGGLIGRLWRWRRRRGIQHIGQSMTS